MQASIITSVYNRPEVFDWQLASIAKQKVNYEFEVVVINDGFKDNGAKEISDKYKEELNIRYLFTGHRHSNNKLTWRSFCWGVNIGIQASNGTVVIIGCDCIHLNDTINTLAQPIIDDPSKKLWTQAGVYQDDNNIAMPYTLKHNGKIHITNFESETDMVQQLKFKQPGYGFFLCGLPRQLLIEMRGWDEDLTGRGYTDNDMFNRLMANGVERIQTMGRAVHLWHPRDDSHYNGMARQGAEVGPNYRILQERKNIVVRNIGRDWGIIPKQ